MTASITPTVANYITQAESQARTVPDIPSHVSLIPIARVGIVGAGTMGGGIAMNFANAGIPARLVETQAAALERGLATVRRNYENSARKGRITSQDVETRMNLLSGSLSLDDLADCDMIIEAVYEDMAVKKQIFTRLDAIAKQGAILATNTSGLNVDEIAAVTRRPEAVIGLHFFSPANVMKLVEVVRADKTSQSVVATCMDLAHRLGKIAVLVGVCPGFVGNRMLYPRQVQAEQLLFEGAMPWDVDRVLCEFGFPMGPFQMADLAGLDIGWSRETSRGETLRDVLCEQGRLGQKNRAGFYDYDENRKPTPSPITEKAVRDFSARKGKTPRTISDSEILERCLYPLINEGARVLEERKALRASDIDVVWLYGYGWPKHRGGPMYYADSVGLTNIAARLRDFARNHGSAFEPSSLLATLASQDRGFLSA
ncbi:MAG TPA: 3-hydroxyacyl-CoA dehydrogenase NAD-binding domain-containing protein [Povalibacter sp.]|uniref:3-hydroxyacyl-CoA dehydrogenase n=1 Tax=Povalibacter sp. TaxID=1962978 RepID=UPI002C569D3C|nr:3-hydroxyacyl-CoA dehydrogenase NAD-binding domain-containing protein [Povalibacter sp.]HMN43041.1 3-hydroxyacyl-CoA dehydrogenase NAD-binding domain-containing protein [Povalibacter sp.]